MRYVCAGLPYVHKGYGILDRCRNLAVKYPYGCWITDCGETGLQCVRYNAATDSVEVDKCRGNMSLSMFKTDLYLRNGFPMDKPCGILSTRGMDGGQDVGVPYREFEAKFEYMGPTDYVTLRVWGPSGLFERRLHYDEPLWGGITTPLGVKTGRFKLKREGHQVSSGSCVRNQVL